MGYTWGTIFCRMGYTCGVRIFFKVKNMTWENGWQQHFSESGSADALFSFMIPRSEWIQLSLLICSKIKIYYNFSVFWTSKKGKQKYSKTREIAKNRSRTQFGFEREIEKSKRKDKSKQQWPHSLVTSQPGLILRIRTKQTLAKAEIFIDFQECLKVAKMGESTFFSHLSYS